MEKINIKDIPIDFFKLLFSPKGRVDNVEYIITWMFTGNILFMIWSSFSEPGLVIGFILLFVFIYSRAVVSIKRCHDLGHSGWCALIPIYNPLYLFLNGTNKENKYGKVLAISIQKGKYFLEFFVFFIILIFLILFISYTSEDTTVDYINDISTITDDVFIINDYISIKNTDGYYQEIEGIDVFDLALTNSEEEFNAFINSDFIGETIYDNVKSNEKSNLLEVLESQIKELNTNNYPAVNFLDYTTSTIYKNGNDVFIVSYKGLIDQKEYYYLSAVIYTINYGVSVNINSNSELVTNNELGNVLNNLEFK